MNVIRSNHLHYFQALAYLFSLRHSVNTNAKPQITETLPVSKCQFCHQSKSLILRLRNEIWRNSLSTGNGCGEEEMAAVPVHSRSSSPVLHQYLRFLPQRELCRSPLAQCTLLKNIPWIPGLVFCWVGQLLLAAATFHHIRDVLH